MIHVLVSTEYHRVTHRQTMDRRTDGGTDRILVAKTRPTYADTVKTLPV